MISIEDIKSAQRRLVEAKRLEKLRSSASRKQYPPHEDYKHDWMEPGASPRKLFCTICSRSGIKGYHMGRLVCGLIKVDLVWPSHNLVVRVGESFSEDEVQALMTYSNFTPVSLPPDPGAEWDSLIERLKTPS